MNPDAQPPSVTPAPPQDPGLPNWPDTPLVQGAARLAHALRAAGEEAYFVGGAVRNWLLGLPLNDIDLVTSARPERVAALFDASRSVGAHFGVQLVPLADHIYEVATFRAEGSYVDHRRPAEVRYGTLAEDYQRRDFTINAMYYDPADGRLIDPAGGRVDLERRLLRAVGDPEQRFEEDALRLMRAVRFAVRYGLELEEKTREAIVHHAATLAEISIERVGEELVKILTGPHPERAMKLLGDLGLWPYIIPEIEPMRGCEQPPAFHPEGDVFVHTALVLENLKEAWPDGPPPPALALAALLHDVGKPPTFVIEDRIRFPEHAPVGAVMTGEIGKHLRWSNQLREQVVDLVAEHMRFMDVKRMRQSTLRRFLGHENFDLHLALHKADCLASHGGLDNYEFCLSERRRIMQEEAEQALLPPPLINGDDLKALGLQPGPIFKDLLEATRDEQLEGRLKTKEDALAWVRAEVARASRP